MRTQWIVDEPSYPSTDARLEVGFGEQRDGDARRYWIDWIEPERSLSVGWHRDDDHPEHGPVHRQLTHGTSVVDRATAAVVNGHPGAIFYHRLEQLADVLERIRWDGDRAIGFGD